MRWVMEDLGLVALWGFGAGGSGVSGVVSVCCWLSGCALVLRAVSLVEGDCGGGGVMEFDRAIRIARLHPLPDFHLRPIDVVVFHGPWGDLVLRLVSRLDAFSGYPFRT